MIKINKMNFFLRLCANNITNNLIEEVLSCGTVRSDSLINEMRQITNQNDLVEMKMVCQFLPILIKQETSRKGKIERTLRTKK